MKQPSKKIALLISSFLPNMGGMEVGLHNIAIRLKKSGWEPTVLAPYSHVRQLKKKGWDLPYEVIAQPPKIWTILTLFPALGFKISSFYLKKMQIKYNFDFWHVTMGYPTGCAMVHFAENSNEAEHPKYLIRCAGEDIQKQPEIGYGMRLNPELDTLISSYLKRAQNLIAITQSVHNEYLSIGVPADAIHDIPNGVDVDRFRSMNIDRSSFRKNLGVKAEEHLILCVGRNHPKKNYKKLLEAGHVLRQNGFEDFKIVCVGKNVDQLGSLRGELNLENHVILKSEVSTNEINKEKNLELPDEELISLYKSADLFVFPSLTETFGIAIVEAMAAGLPVIVGDSEGCRDIVENGKWGAMCDPNNANDIAEKINRFLCNEDLKEFYKNKSSERANFFDWDKIVDQYIKIYQS